MEAEQWALGDAVAQVDLELGEDTIGVRSEVRCRGKTGVEMEALTAASVAASPASTITSASKGCSILPGNAPTSGKPINEPSG